MPPRVAAYVADEEHFDMRALRRLVAWGSGAAVAVAAVVLAGTSQPGAQRLAEVLGRPAAMRAEASMGQPALARSTEADAETRRLAESVRTLAADRDRMAARIASLERSLDDVTGSLGRDAAPSRGAAPPARAAPAPAAPAQAASAPAASPSSPSAPAKSSKFEPPPTADAPATVMAAAGVAAPVAPAPAANAVPASPVGPVAPAALSPAGDPPGTPASALPQGWPLAASLPLEMPGDGFGDASPWPDEGTSPAADSVAIRTEFGVDIGGGASVEALRALWVSAKNTYGGLLSRLRPIVGIREVRPGYVELRLIVGPLADAGAAAKLCAALGPHGRTCRPAPFDGQRLALR